MATLSQALQNQRKTQTAKGPGGQLTEEKPEGIQTLAGNAGMPAPPLTPVGAAALGANADQQKMMGTPAQKQAALNTVAQPAQNLTTALRTQQSRTQMTAEEQQKQQKAQASQGLAATGDRVQQFINNQRTALQQQAQAPAPLQVQTAEEFNGQALTPLQQDLQTLRSNPQDMEAMLRVNQSLGFTAENQLSPEQINDLYETSTSTLSRSTAEVVDDSISVGSLFEQPEFGYNASDLSNLLGVPEDQISGMSIGQLQEAINAAQQQEFSATQNLEQKAQSGLAGQAERQAALQAQRESSTTGMRATEADYSSIQQQIQNADKVTFGGREMQVDELLRDETISSLVQEYLQAGQDSDVRKQLEATEPQLIGFINKNKTLLEDAARQLSAGASGFQAIQKDNQALANADGIQLSKSIAEKLIPGFGKLSASRVDPNSIPLFKALSLTPDRKAKAFNAINMAEEKYENVADQLQGLDEDSIVRLGIGKEGGMFQKWTEAQDQKARVESIPASDMSSLISEAFDGETLGSFQRKQESARVLGAFGLDSGLGIDIRNPGDIKQSILSEISAGSLQEASQGQVSGYRPKKLGDVQMPKEPQKAFWVDMGSKFAADGSLDADDLKAMTSKVDFTTPDGLESLRVLEDMANTPGASVDKQEAIRLREKATNSISLKTLTEIKNNFTHNRQRFDKYRELQEQAKQDPKSMNSATVNTFIAQSIGPELAKGNFMDMEDWIREARAISTDGGKELDNFFPAALEAARKKGAGSDTLVRRVYAAFGKQLPAAAPLDAEQQRLEQIKRDQARYSAPNDPKANQKARDQLNAENKFYSSKEGAMFRRGN